MHIEERKVTVREVTEGYFNDAEEGPCDWDKVHKRLADLIEPEPERTCHVTMRDRYEVRGGQYIEDWDLSCGDHILIDGDMPDVGLRCPVCGARVV